MIQQLLNVSETTPVTEMRARLGEVLGMKGPVPMPVLLRAINDPGFATDLITCRNAPNFLAALFDDRRTRAYEPVAEKTPMSSTKLASKAAAAMVRWGRAGFSTVDAETLERREGACLTCPHLTEPESMLQKMVPVAKVSNAVGSRLGRKTCALCGCVVTKKIRLPTENCPDAHPALADQTRWREPAVVRRADA